MKQRAFRYIRSDECPSCGSLRCLELYDNSNRPVNLTRSLDNNMNKIITLRQLSHFECINCSREFKIDWTHVNDIPFPLQSRKYMEAINLYNSLKKN